MGKLLGMVELTASSQMSLPPRYSLIVRNFLHQLACSDPDTLKGISISN
jgi:hypothetical protein